MWELGEGNSIFYNFKQIITCEFIHMSDTWMCEYQENCNLVKYIFAKIRQVTLATKSIKIELGLRRKNFHIP